MKTILKYLMLTSILLGDVWATTQVLQITDGTNSGTTVTLTVPTLALSAADLEIRSADSSDVLSTGTDYPGVLSTSALTVAAPRVLTLNRARLTLAADTTYGDATNLTLRIAPYAGTYDVTNFPRSLPAVLVGYTSARWTSTSAFKTWLLQYLSVSAITTNTNKLAVSQLLVDVSGTGTNYVQYGTLVKDSLTAFSAASDRLTVATPGAADISGNASLVAATAIAAGGTAGTYTLTRGDLTLPTFTMGANCIVALSGYNLALGDNVVTTGRTLTYTASGAEVISLAASISHGAFVLGADLIIDLCGYNLTLAGIISGAHTLTIKDSVGAGICTLGTYNHSSTLVFGSAAKPVIMTGDAATYTSIELTNASRFKALGSGTISTLIVG